MKKKKLFLNGYKNIKYFFFKLFYGKIKKIIIAKKNKKINIEKIYFNNLISYNLYNIPNGRLYSDTTNDTAFILNKSLVKEPSFQFRYKKNLQIINGSTNENFVLKNGTPNLLKKIDGNIFSLLTGGAGKTNYWHWLFDVLPRIGILEKSSYKHKPSYYLLPSTSKKYQTQSLQELKISPANLIDGEKNKHIMCKNLIAVDHPINFKNNPSKSILDIPLWLIIWLRKKYIKTKYTKKNTCKNFFISRESDSNLSSRKIINNEKLKKYLFSLGFKSIILSNLSFKNQVKMFNNANFIIGLHGAGFANMVFCNPSTKIIEITSHEGGNAISNLAKKCKLNYKKIIEKNITTKLQFQNAHILVDINKLKKTIFSFK